jgi:hypothetical protein
METENGKKIERLEKDLEKEQAAMRAFGIVLSADFPCKF